MEPVVKRLQKNGHGTFAVTGYGQRTEGSMWRVWSHMLQRCYNPRNNRFQHYGGRGIQVYEPWHMFDTFLTDILSTIGHKPANPSGISGRYWSFDRVDNDGNYEPGNVRWATPKQQVDNRRNVLKTECKSGHPLTGDNVLFINTTDKRGLPRIKRLCRICTNARTLKHHRKRRERMKAELIT
jgi:hypothetical protein